MVSVFEFKDYKEYLQAWLEARPKGGRGEARKIAARLGISTTLVSQIFNGDKHFTMESASELADHLVLSEREADHFLLLVDYARAGSHGLKTKLKKRIDKSRELALKLTERVEVDRILSDAEAAAYYSHWIYTGVTNFIATAPKTTNVELAERLKVPEALIARVMSFLIESGILVLRKDGYDIGAKTTYVTPESLLVVKHHQNWRLQGFNYMPYVDKQNFFITAPMSLSQEVAERIRADLPAYIEKIQKWIGPSPSETVRCLNIDWFEY